MPITLAPDMRRDVGIRLPGGAPAVDPAAALLAEAVAYWDASSYTSGQTLANLGTIGSSLDMRLGSTTGADSNDPTHLPHTGVDYLWSNGGSNYLRYWVPPTATSYRATRLDDTTATGATSHGFPNRNNFTTAGSWKKFELLNASSDALVTYDFVGGSLSPAEDIGNYVSAAVSGYETDPGGAWVTSGPINPATEHGRSTNRARTGTYSYRVMCDGTQYQGGVYAPNFVKHLKSLTSYTVTGFIYLDPGSSSIEVFVRTNSYTGTQSVVISTTGEWVPFSFTITSNQENEGGGVIPGFEMFVRTTGWPAATWYMDDLSVVETTPAPLPARLVSVGGIAAVTNPQFAFVDDMLAVTDASPLDTVMSGDFSIVAQWVTPANGSYTDMPFASGCWTTEQSGALLAINVHGSGLQIAALVSDGTSRPFNVWKNGGDLAPGQLMVAGMNLTRSTSSGLRIFHDGVIDPTGRDASALGAVTNGVGAFVGHHPAGAYSRFSWGKTAIFDRILTQDDIDIITEAWS
jgi:hypothetical protein